MRRWLIFFIIISLYCAACSAISQVGQSPIGSTVASSPSIQNTSTVIAIPTVTEKATLASTLIPLTPHTGNATQSAPTPPFISIARIEAGEPITLTHIQMSDVLSGWGIETTGHIVKTSDGGNSWTDITPPRGAYASSGLFAMGENIAWASPKSWCGTYIGDCQSTDQFINAAIVYRTDDGGKTWQPSQPFSLRTSFSRDQIAYFPHLFFLNAQIGWNLTWVFASHMGEMYQELYKTSDGGATWQRLAGEVELQNSFMGAISSYVFLDEQTGWAVENGSYDSPAKIHQTTDGGLSWPVQTIPAIEDFLGDPHSNCTVSLLYQEDAQSGLGIGCSGQSTNFFDITHDGGQNWLSWTNLQDVSFVNQTTGWGLYFPTNHHQSWIQQTNDGGNSWENIKLTSWQSAQFDFVDPENGWAIVSIDGEIGLLHTINGGKTWAEIKPSVNR